MGRMETICRELGCEASEVFGMVLELVAATEELRAARVRAEQEERAARAESWELMRAHLVGEAVDMEFMEAAREFWLDDPWSVNKVLGVEVVNAYNPYGCNQHDHSWVSPCPYDGGAPIEPKKTEYKAKDDRGKNLAEAIEKRDNDRREEAEKKAEKKAAKQEKRPKPETTTEKKEKSDVDKVLAPRENIGAKENELYKKLVRGGLSKKEQASALEAWNKAHEEYWKEVEKAREYSTPADTTSYYRRMLKIDDQIERHFAEISELYPEAVK